MYRVDRNNFYTNAKNATVYTPLKVSQFLFERVHEKIQRNALIFDPCVGKGSLLMPFHNAGFRTLGMDLCHQGFCNTQVGNYMDTNGGDMDTPGLVIMNPPFNINQTTRELVASKYGRRPLLPEVWLGKTIELFGHHVPIILFAPYGMRLNQSLTSQRWRRFIDGTYPPICSIVALPKDIYEDVMFHSEILIFNMKGLDGHYFYDG